ncbi:MAG: PaaX domain-containing protein, C- domain protein [Acidimicrobiales bacterium]|nr:PaaX domain-containing protein, C- domain protein [Acidimicrobiales bacterium]
MQERKERAGLVAGDGLLERPLTARSIVASLLLGMRPPRLSSARLVAWCGLLGVAEGTTRVALSRMVERGELRVHDGVYELAGPVRERQAGQDFSLAPSLRPWRGRWVLAVVTAADRTAPDRVSLRTAASRLRLGELREGLWARPDNLPPTAAPADARAVVAEQCAWWRGRPDEPAAELAERLFAPAAWSSRARSLRQRLDAVTVALESRAGDPRPADLAEGFVVGAATLQHLRRDPLLPPALLPDDPPGEGLRAAYRTYQQVYGHAVAAWFRAGPGRPS